MTILMALDEILAILRSRSVLIVESVAPKPDEYVRTENGVTIIDHIDTGIETPPQPREKGRFVKKEKPSPEA